MPGKTDQWLNLNGIPGLSKKRPKVKTPELSDSPQKKNGIFADKKPKTDSSSSALVAKAASIDIDGVTCARDGVLEGKANKFHKTEHVRIGDKTANDEYQEIFQDILRRKMKDSWLNTTYQRAIWNARRRLMRGEILDDLPEDEKHLVSHLVSPRMKPDYSKWSYSKKKYPHGLRLPHMHELATSSATKMNVKDIAQRGLPQHLVQSISGNGVASDLESGGIQVYPIEFVSLSDRLTLHEPPWLAALRDGAETNDYDQFGLCYGCFHRRGPHYHYQAPVRTGGGFTIYRPNPLELHEHGHPNTKLESIRWANQDDHDAGYTGLDQEVHDATFGDDFTARLFHAFLDNGGDPNALREYLESNFDAEVLKELEQLGANVQLIKEYAELLRDHIRNTLSENLAKQHGIVKVNDREINFVKRFIEVTSAGGDLEMLLAILEDGKSCSRIQDYEKAGGNIELLEHYASKLLSEFAGIDESMEDDCKLSADQKELKADLSERLRKYIENELDHKHAALLLEYMSKGGRLDVLVEYVDRGASSPGVVKYETANGDLSLVRQYAEKFPNKAMLLREIEKFVKDHFRNYTSANLLQKYVENGGKVKVLKQYVRDGCSFSSDCVQYYVKEGGNVRLLQDIGQEFASDQTILEDLEQFPDDPKVLEAYIRRGGSFPRLVRAIADAMGDPLIEAYVKRRTEAAMNDLKITQKTEARQNLSGKHSKSASGLLQTNFYPPPNSPDHTDVRHASTNDVHSMLDSPNSLANNLLPKLLETAKAELKYDKLVAAEEILNQNEGAFLAKAVGKNQEMLPVTSVALTTRDRYPPLSIFQSSESKDSSTVSLITGKRRPKLWKAPAPFMIKKSEIEPTRPISPFSQDRAYDIQSLSEDQILGVQKRQRHDLDVLRRNYNSRDFSENWRVAITSPDGSVISELDSTIAGEFEETKPVNWKKSEPESETRKKDKVSRRERQRAKMKAMKSKPNQNDAVRSPSPGRISSASSSSTLLVPEAVNKEPAAALPKEAIFTRAKEDSVLDDTSKSRRKSSRRSITTSRRDSRARNSTSTIASKSDTNRNLTLGVTSMTMLGSGDLPIEPERPETKENASNSSTDDEMTKHIIGKPAHVVPPLPMISDMNAVEDEVESPTCQTAFGKTTPGTPRSKIPIFPGMIENPQTQMSEGQKDHKSEFQINLNSRAKQRKPKQRLEEKQESMEELSTDDTTGVAVEDVLKKYCIIREERIPRYRLIFDKHLMLREMRLHERAAKAQRANNSMLNEDDFQISLEQGYGPAHDELRKLEFIAQILDEKTDDVENEITVAQGCLDRAKALTGRELLFKNKKLLKTPRKRKTPRSRGAGTETEDFRNGIEVMENMETAMGASQRNKAYDYDQSARPGFESRNASSARRIDSPATTPRARIATPVSATLPLEELSDSQVLNKLDGKTRKMIAGDPVVKHNVAAVSVLQDKLNRMKERQKKLQKRLETQHIEVRREKEALEAENLQRERFVRQQSTVYQALHPLEDPVLAIDDIPEALRDINGEISRADSAVILDALDFPRHSDGVNFRVFCILAALSESALSIQPLVRRLARTRDAKALNVKMDRCKEIYGNLLGPNLEILQAELRFSGFTSAQYQQVLRKLTRDEGGLSFLDFVTYVPLFLDIHQKIVANPLTA